jgi:cation:H+ antiporter
MTWTLDWSIGLFLLAAVTVGLAGTRLAGVADKLADETGLGEAIFGAVFLGATTSLSGSVTSVVSAAEGHPQLAISNAVGGIGVQTTFLAVADVAHRKANLEHAAASVANLVQGALVIVLLAASLLAITGPDVTFWSVHPITPILLAGYIFGITLVSRASNEPMWNPRSTSDTVVDLPADPGTRPSRVWILWARFTVLALLVGASGWVLARSGIQIASLTGLSETLIGTLFTAVSTSVPELVTSVAAVRRGALTLAVSNIIGGNMFDTLMFPMADVAYRSGSIYHVLSTGQVFWLALTILLTGVLMIGLLHRERHGIANIGFESVLLVMLYLAGVSVLVLGLIG